MVTRGVSDRGSRHHCNKEGCTVREDTVCDIRVVRSSFVQQVVMHHRAGDHYPDPRVIAQELRLSSMQTETVLQNLRARGWIAASPYDPERLRLTPHCWESLRRMSESSSSLG